VSADVAGREVLCLIVPCVPTIQRFEPNTVHLQQLYTLVLTMPDCGLASILLRIASKITAIRRTQHSIATSDILSRAVDVFRAAQLPAYADGTLVIAAHKSDSWLFLTNP